MNRIILLVVFISIVITSYQKVDAQDLSGNIGFSLCGGVGIPTNGNYFLYFETTDILKVGPQFGLGVSYYLTQGFGLELMANYGFNYYKNEYKIIEKDPIFSNFVISVNGIYNFRHLLNNPNVSPILTAGVGLYNWAHLKDGIGSDVMALTINNFNGEVTTQQIIEFKGSSFGFNLGIGADIKVNNNFTIGLIFDYNMFFPKDEEKFGEYFAEQGYLSPQVKFNYYIPTK